MNRLIGYFFMVFALFVLPCAVFAGHNEDNGCARGEPDPVYSLKSPGVKSRSFKKKSANEAVEEIVFKSGDRLRIRNWGCEYFVNTFYYESKAIAGSTADIAAWFLKSAEVIRKLSRSKPDLVFDLEKTAKTLEMKAKENLRLRFNHKPYPVEGDGVDFLETKVVVKGGGKVIGKQAGYVEFELMKGPL